VSDTIAVTLKERKIRQPGWCKRSLALPDNRG